MSPPHSDFRRDSTLACGPLVGFRENLVIRLAVRHASSRSYSTNLLYRDNWRLYATPCLVSSYFKSVHAHHSIPKVSPVYQSSPSLSREQYLPVLGTRVRLLF